MGVDSNLYKFFTILHVITVVAAFGPMFVLSRLVATDAPGAGRLYLRFVLPALVLVWVIGMGLLGLSDDAFEVSTPWVSLSIVVWAALVAVGLLLVRPGIASPEQRSKLSAGIGITHLLLVVGLWLMVFKPSLWD